MREYASVNFLKNASEIIKISDIGQVRDVTADDVDEENKNAQIIGVLQLDTYKICLRCKARAEPATPPLGRCSKSECAMLQRYDVYSQHLSAKLLVMSNSNMQSLNVFRKLVRDLANISDDAIVSY